MELCTCEHHALAALHKDLNVNKVDLHLPPPERVEHPLELSMVHLRNCQARLTSEHDARCNLEVARNEPFCPVHNAEYHALVARGGAAAEDLRNLDGLVARDVDTNNTHEIVQRDVGDLERYLQALDDGVETRLILSKRFFTEPEHRALEAVGELQRNRTSVVAVLRRIRERGVAVEEERRNRREDEDRKAGKGGPEVELRMKEQPQPEQRRLAEETVQDDREETHGEAGTARREVEVPPGAVEAVCDEPEETESVVGPEGQPTHNEDTADHSQTEKSENSTSSQEETTEEVERRREQVKHRIKVLNEYRRKKAAELSKRAEEPKETLRTETATVVGSHGEERSGIEVAGRVALACAVVGVAVFLGLRSKDAILR
ncbi:hypothetical protein K466DRAFT_198592 [Polyporus arcularius HHB13444]|uniref:Uncharacterized protein n=1 Tax=Polyporus arcularius HHB13444 TaxID=1314778 RepID=A0A5C3P6H7_9APHY|nr:hypothetical protein K466DRAFT_198592 [Polyporus arcularius HHB13444]